MYWTRKSSITEKDAVGSVYRKKPLNAYRYSTNYWKYTKYMAYKNPEDAKAYAANYRAEHKEELALKSKLWHEANREEQNRKAREKYHLNKAEISAKRKLERPAKAAKLNADNRARYHKNKPKIRIQRTKREKERLQTDPEFKIKKLCTVRIHKMLNRAGLTKTERTDVYVGCTPKELKQHLESQFRPGMTWNNLGTYGWNIDHKTPAATLKLSDEEQKKQACNYRNLQPLWWYENNRKRANEGFVPSEGNHKTEYHLCWKEGPLKEMPDSKGNCRRPENHNGDCYFC